MSGSSMNTFWSLLIEPGKTYERTVESGIHVTRCALDTSAVKSESDEGLVQVILEHCGQASTVANLSVKHSIFQTDLDLFFQCGEEVSFTTSGVKVPVTLTGLCGVDLGEPESDSDDDYEEGSCDDTIDETFEADDDTDVLGKRKITKTSGSASKKSKLSALNDVTLASDSDSDDEHYNPVADDSSMLVDEAEDIETEETDSEQDDSDVSDDDEEEDSDEDEEVEEESVVEESPVKPKKAKKSLDSKAIKTLKVKSPEQKSTPKPSKVEKLKNKEANKSQTSSPLNVSKAKISNGKENKEGKNTKGEKKLKEPEAKGTPKSEKKKKNKQILAGSVTSEDIVAGNGKVAKNNSMLRQ